MTDNRRTNTATPGTPANPLKDDNQTKRTAREKADDAAPAGPKGKTAETATGQGGNANQPGRTTPDTGHPSQRGGVTADFPHTAEDHPDRPGVKRGPSPADAPSSGRTGTAPDRSGGPTRSGTTDESRRKKGRDV